MPFIHRGHFLYSSGLSFAALEDGEMTGKRALGLSPEIWHLLLPSRLFAHISNIYIYTVQKYIYKTPEQCRL
jgi:hypothetical protein